MRLLRRHNLTLLRTSGKGYYDENGDWVAPTKQSFTIQGNAQPYRKGDTTLVLPDGIRQDDAKILWTKADVRVDNYITGALPDVIVINGLEYEAFAEADWLNQLRRAENKEILLVRRDRINAASRTQ